MALPDLSGQNIQDTYQRVLTVGEGGHMFDGTGSLFIPLSASVEINYETSSSFANTSAALVMQPSINVTNITASGNISSSGIINAQQLNLSNQTFADFDGSTYFRVATSRQMAVMNNLTVAADPGAVAGVRLNATSGDITASGNISSSGGLSINNSATLKSHVYIGSHLGERSLYIDKFSTAYPYAHIFAGAADNNTKVGIKLVTRNNAGTAQDGLVIDGNTREATFANVVNATAINTGQGDNELYAMNQDVETSDNVTFNQVTVASTVSSSGTVIGNRLQTDDFIVGDTSLDTGLLIDGYVEATGVAGRIIASATISASGNVYGPTFGNTAGNLIAENDISASGNVYGTGFYGVTNFRLHDAGGTSRHVITNGSDDLTIEIGNSNFSNGVLIADAHLTASGNISASGTIVGSNLSGTNTGDQDLSGYVLSSITSSLLVRNSETGSFLTSIPTGTYSSSLQTLGHITASGNISSSGDIIGAKLIVGNPGTPNIDVADWNNVSLLLGDFGNSITMRGTETILNNGGLDVQSGHITASGNISSSGNIYSANEEFFHYSFQSDNSTGDWFGPNKQGPNYYFWNLNYGNDTQVQTIDWSSTAGNERLLNSGLRVPHKMEITRFGVSGWNNLNAGAGEAFAMTCSILIGSPEQGAPGNSSLSLNQVGTFISSTGESRYAGTSGSFEFAPGQLIVSESQYIYPRVKAQNDNQDIYGNWTIYYKRVK